MMPKEMHWQGLSRLVGRHAKRKSSMNKARKVANVTKAVTWRLSRPTDNLAFQLGCSLLWAFKSKTEPEPAHHCKSAYETRVAAGLNTVLLPKQLLRWF